ncbi:MAG: glycosyltransferase [Treponema sp.]|nr:glycosyltransferase [Treponema sp.]
MINITQEEIIQNWGNAETPLVSVICCTYNHEPYIAQTLEGFLIQKTNFPFEVLVNDDASTDGTAKIIKEYEEKYPSIIKPFYHDVNEYSQGIDIFGNLVKLAKGKYIAICEGDDYWIDENKLQMQVDFLEKNPDYGLCYTYARRFYQSTQKFSKKRFGKKQKTAEDLIINGDKIPTLTICLRNNEYRKYMDFMNKHDASFAMGDYPLVLWFSINTKVHCIKKITSIYRILEKSASHFVSIDKAISFIKSSNACQRFFCRTFNLKISEEKLDSIFQYMYIWKLLGFHDFVNAKIESKKLVPYHFKSLLMKFYCTFILNK